MKIILSVLSVAILASSCKDNKEATEVTPLLKSDTTFVVKPELPVKETEATTETIPEEKKQVVAKKKTTSKSSSSTTQNTSSQGSSNTANQNNSTAATQPAAAEPEKKGWSKTAKGAVVGTVVGAGAGAIINKKNRVAGAVIGGVIGAGAGAVVGNEMDKKDGRH